MQIRPYIIYPKLIEQPTWGGTYIVSYKNWQQHADLSALKIGQSYELFGGSKLSLNITDTTASEFGPDTKASDGTLSLDSLSDSDAQNLLGPYVFEKHKKMPLLIKFTQAKGNSFQLHKKPEVNDPDWLPKAESWYFLEDGYMTFGLKKGTSVEEYKKTCEEIYVFMQSCSKQIQSGEISMELAKEKAITFIKEKNPWQFVNVYHVPKFTMVDLSLGGLHHSWEEDPTSVYGNIVYEVQQDAPDDTSTLRSFDQGKFKTDGSIRPLTIEKYFSFLDINDDHNDVEKAKQYPQGNRILTTKNYYMDQYTIESDQTITTGESFAHLFVRDGDVNVSAGDTTVRVTKGHSSLIPHVCNNFTIHSNVPNSIVIRTGIEKL